MKHKEVGIIVCVFCIFLWAGSTSYAQTPPQTALNEAAALLQSHRFDEAEAATRKILTTNPKNPDAHALLALVLDQRGQHAEAEREYQAALKLKPNLVSALSNFG